MKLLIARKKIILSNSTVHKYMKELGLTAIVRRKRPSYLKGKAHRVFPNLVRRDFHASKPNRIWVTDFTCMRLTNGAKRYNCTILDLYDRSVVATLNSKEMNAKLAIETLDKALYGNAGKIHNLILHSDQGSQYTSKDFVEYCRDKNITQSMSKAGCPYDNAPMERFYSSFKTEFYYLFNFKDDISLNQGVNDYVYNWYNHLRPHSFNGGLTPFEARSKIL